MLRPQLGPTLTLPALYDTCTSPTLLSDTRQREGRHNNVLTAAARRGFPVQPAQLSVGDYMLVSPEGLTSRATIDTKRGLGEVAQNLTVERDRVSREMARARSMGMVLLFLVELDEDEFANVDTSATLCDVCPRSASCRHDGTCAQHGVTADFSSPRATLLAFADFARSWGSLVAYCPVDVTGDVVLDLLTTGQTVDGRQL